MTESRNAELRLPSGYHPAAAARASEGSVLGQRSQDLASQQEVVSTLSPFFCLLVSPRALMGRAEHKVNLQRRRVFPREPIPVSQNREGKGLGAEYVIIRGYIRRYIRRSNASGSFIKHTDDD